MTDIELAELIHETAKRISANEKIPVSRVLAMAIVASARAQLAWTGE